MDKTNTLPLKLPNGTIVYVEVSPLKSTAGEDVSFRSAEEALEVGDIQAAIEGIGEMLVAAVNKLAPSKTSVEFGIEIAVEPGKVTALWVKGSGKANLKVTLEWSQPDARR
jgi:Trypsin-co-occurring domain 1